LHQLLLLRHIPECLHLGTDRHQLILGLLPVAAGDEILHLIQFGARSECHLVIADLSRGAEEHRAQPIEGIAGAGARHHGTESTDTHHGSGRGTDHAQSTPAARGGRRPDVPNLPVDAARLLRQSGIQRGDRVGF
jgi:hypothetical protein